MRRIARLGAFLVVASPATSATLPTSLATLNDTLLRLPVDGPESTVAIDLPVGGGRTSRFDLRDSRTLPAGLTKRFPGLRSFRGTDGTGRTVRLDLASGGVRIAVRDDTTEWAGRAATPSQWHALAQPSSPVSADITGRHAIAGIEAPVHGPPHLPSAGSSPSGPSSTSRSGGMVRYDFRLAVAVGSRLAAAWGGGIENALGEVAHRVNRANEVFETDVGVHFTLVAASDRLVMTRAKRDPFLQADPAPSNVGLIDRTIGASGYDIGHAMLDIDGGESDTGTSCSDARDADFLETHKAAAWSGGDAALSPRALDAFIHVLGRQLGAWPTANGCQRDTLDDRAFEPGAGTTAMSYAFATCRRESVIQDHADRYFHAANIEQMQDWLAGSGGRCATRRLLDLASPWIDPRSLDRRILVPARTPFTLAANVVAGEPGRRLTYTWDQMDAGDEERGPLADDGHGPLFRSLPPSPKASRDFPRWPGAPGETPATSTRDLSFRLTVRDNAGDASTTASADIRVRVIDTGRAFAMITDDVPQTAMAGAPMTVRWDVADTDAAPLSCHFVHIDLSTDDGESWHPIASDEPNDGVAHPLLPVASAGTRAHLRVRCDNRPFFAVSPAAFTVGAVRALP